MIHFLSCVPFFFNLMYEKSCDESRPNIPDSAPCLFVQMFNICYICKNDFYLEKKTQI